MKNNLLSKKETGKEGNGEISDSPIPRFPDSDSSFSRRDFLRLMGFSVGAASLAACETPVQKTIPYLIQPEEITPGIANYYASTYFDGHDYCSILVKTREGRPIKIEGNKKSNITYGGTSARVQASVLSLYDSQRLKGPKAKGTDTDWKKADEEIISQLNNIAQTNGNIRLLSSTVISPSAKKVIADFISKYPAAKHIVYDPVSYYAIAKANENVLHKKCIPSYHFEKAKVIVSFAADFLVNWLSPVEHAWQYAQGRKPIPNSPSLTLPEGKGTLSPSGRVGEGLFPEGKGSKEISKHIQFETILSVTGSNADVRIPVKPSELGFVVLKLYNDIAGKAKAPLIALKDLASDYHDKDVAAIGDELWENKGNSLVVCGVNDVAIQTIVAALNKILGNYGNTIDIDNHSNLHQGNDEDFSELIKEMNGGNVSALLIYNSNPAYTAPGFSEAIKKVPLKISFSSAMDETAALCDYVCPDHHYLEAWNDAEPVKNNFSLAQPCIAPLFNTRAAQESLLKWAECANTDYHSYIQNHWRTQLLSDLDDSVFMSAWNISLHDGVADFYVAPVLADDKNEELKKVEKKEDTAVEEKKLSLFDFATMISHQPSTINHQPSTYELVLYETTALGIGNQANNPWLQELPDPITKCTWDNYLTMNPADMKGKYSLLERGNQEGDVAELTMDNGKWLIVNVKQPSTISHQPLAIRIPVFPQPGQARGTVGLALGYGRTNAGKVADGVGVNAFQFLQWKNNTIQNYLSGIKISGATGEKHAFACTQTHHTMMGRSIARETTLENYLNKEKEDWNPSTLIPILNKEGEHTERPAAEVNLWGDHPKPGHRWGLAIDLQSCIGCGACVVSCSAENNVPVVGKEEVRNSREMHWIRIDRYYSSDMNEEKGREEGKGKVETLREMETPSENPSVSFQPVMCQHCNHAPCETVCPVLATTHSSEGLNMMTYNRCIGTRYCANNCPYKVRRFNWFQYDSNKQFAEVNPASYGNDLGRMVLNPDLVVRSRGVMEKCTFCVQRIEEGKLNAKKEGRALGDGEIETACQSACPTKALVFGDLNNPETQISKLFNDNRRYLLLEEVGIQPNAFYLTKVKNT